MAQAEGQEAVEQPAKPRTIYRISEEMGEALEASHAQIEARAGVRLSPTKALEWLITRGLEALQK